MGIGTIAGSLGRGLAAGFFGTAAMTVAQQIEMKISGRGASTTPADAVEEVFDLQPRTEQGEQRLSQAAHFAYGTAWGGVRGLLGGLGVPARWASPAHFMMVWGAAATSLPRLGVAPELKEWGAKQIATDLLLHAVYAAATSVAFEWLEGRARGVERQLSSPVEVDDSGSVMEPTVYA